MTASVCRTTLALLFIFIFSIPATAQINKIELDDEIMEYNISGMGTVGNPEDSQTPWGFFRKYSVQAKANKHIWVTCTNKKIPKNKEVKEIRIEVQFFGEAVNGRLTEAARPIQKIEKGEKRVSVDFYVPEKCSGGMINIYYYTQKDHYIYVCEEFLVGGSVSKPAAKPKDVCCPVCKAEDSGMRFSTISGNVWKGCSNAYKGADNRKAMKSDVLYLDDVVTTYDKSSALIYEKHTGSRFNVEANSSVVIGTRDAAFKLNKGKFWADIKKLANGKKINIKLTRSIISVKGTVVAFEETETESRVWLFAGDVDVTSTKTGNVSTLKPGERSVVGTDGEIKVYQFDIEDVAKKFGISMSDIDNLQTETASRQNNDNTIYEVAATQPEYPGGLTALKSFFEENIHYPTDAKKQGADGFVILQFVVEKNGSLSDIKVIRNGKLPSMDAEALRVCKLVKGFNPGLNESGEPVRVKFTYPVHFKLP